MSFANPAQKPQSSNTMLALASLALAVSSPSMALSQSKVLALRGGMSLGPLNPGNFEGGLKVCHHARAPASSRPVQPATALPMWRACGELRATLNHNCSQYSTLTCAGRRRHHRGGRHHLQVR